MSFQPSMVSNTRHEASQQFRRIRKQGRWGKIWSSLLGHRTHLLELSEVEEQIDVLSRRYAGTCTVPVDSIQGSEGRCQDFDVNFRPLQSHTQERWVGVAVAIENGVTMPAVDLVQVGDVYFVRDGHHRISVAKARGQLEIDAQVTVWHGQEKEQEQSPLNLVMSPA